MLASPVRPHERANAHCRPPRHPTTRRGVPCQVAPFSCRYLGAPLSLQRLRRSEEQRVVDAVAARIPTWKAGLINTDAESLTKTTLSAILVHVSMVCCLSAWAIQQIDQRRIGGPSSWQVPIRRSLIAPNLFRAISRRRLNSTVTDALFQRRWSDTSQVR